MGCRSFFSSLALLPTMDFLFPLEVAGADWIFTEKDDEGLWGYDAEMMEHFPDHQVKVRTRKIYDRKAVLAAMEKYGKGYEDLDHVLAEWEIACFQRKFYLHSTIFYSKENVAIERYQPEKEGALTPEEIPPDSYLELLRRKVCR